MCVCVCLWVQFQYRLRLLYKYTNVQKAANICGVFSHFFFKKRSFAFAKDSFSLFSFIITQTPHPSRDR